MRPQGMQGRGATVHALSTTPHEPTREPTVFGKSDPPYGKPTVFGKAPPDWKIMHREEIITRLKLLRGLLQDREDWQHLMTVICASFNLTEAEGQAIRGETTIAGMSSSGKTVALHTDTVQG